MFSKRNKGNTYLVPHMFLDKETFVAHGLMNTFYSEELLSIQRLCTPALVNLFALTRFQETSKKIFHKDATFW